MQTLSTEQAAPALTDSSWRWHDPSAHLCKVRPPTFVGWTSLSVNVHVNDDFRVSSLFFCSSNCLLSSSCHNCVLSSLPTLYVIPCTNLNVSRVHNHDSKVSCLKEIQKKTFLPLSRIPFCSFFLKSFVSSVSFLFSCSVRHCSFLDIVSKNSEHHCLPSFLISLLDQPVETVPDDPPTKTSFRNTSWREKRVDQDQVFRRSFQISIVMKDRYRSIYQSRLTTDPRHDKIRNVWRSTVADVWHAWLYYFRPHLERKIDTSIKKFEWFTFDMEETLRLLVDGIVGSFVFHARGSEKGEKK